MATARGHDHDRIGETTTQAPQAEPGPSVLALLAASTGLAVLILGLIWFVFFRIYRRYEHRPDHMPEPEAPASQAPFGLPRRAISG